MKKRILDLDITQKAAAKRIGVDEGTLINWRVRRTVPDLRWWPRVISFVGYDPRPASVGIGEGLIQWRQGRGMSQKKLAKMLDVDPTTLARWERGEREPWVAARVKVERLLR